MSQSKRTLTPSATAGIYAEVINQIYDSLDKRFREAISNSFDANATEVVITVYKHADSIARVSIRDDGDGMDETDLREKYIRLGGGDNYSDLQTIGRIGIGALSVFALGDRIKIRSRKKGGDQVLTATLDLARVKSETAHATPLDQVEIGEIISVEPALSTEADKFTEIVVEDISRPVRQTFESEQRTESLITQLERILPVRPRKDDALFDKLGSGEILDAILGSNYFIKVKLDIPHMEIRARELFRRTAYSVKEAQIEKIIPLYPLGSPLDGTSNQKLRAYGYLVLNKQRQFPRDWQGINARVKNVTIERNTYFRLDEDQASRVRIGGELFIEHIDENKAIQSNRSGFAVENEDYMAIEHYMTEQLRHAIADVRKSDKINSIVKKLVAQVERLHAMCDSIATTEDAKPDADAFQAFEDDEVELDEAERFSLPIRLKRDLGHAGFDADITWSSTLVGSYYVEYEEDGYYQVLLDAKLEHLDFDVAGNSVEFVPSFCGTDRPPIIKKGQLIYINLDSPLLGGDIEKLDVGFSKVVTVLYLNYLRCNGDASALYNTSIRDLAKRR